jgi:hypothetical protein
MILSTLINSIRKKYLLTEFQIFWILGNWIVIWISKIRKLKSKNRIQMMNSNHFFSSRKAQLISKPELIIKITLSKKQNFMSRIKSLNMLVYLPLLTLKMKIINLIKLIFKNKNMMVVNLWCKTVSHWVKIVYLRSMQIWILKKKKLNIIKKMYLPNIAWTITF